jgi:glutamate/tyrosine decarboxylase-like PLP-dependent enzyme
VLVDAPPAFRAFADADSVAVDPHKWLYAPIEAGCALVRDPEHLRHAFSFHPPYFRFDGAAEDPPTNFYELGPQNSRGFRALKVWLTIRQIGRDGYRRMIADDIALARELYELAESHDDLEALTHGLSIATFRYVPSDLRDGRDAAGDAHVNALNTEILSALQGEGEVYLSNAILGGRFALRACVVNFRTTSADLRRVVEATVRVGRRIDAAMRPNVVSGRR